MDFGLVGFDNLACGEGNNNDKHHKWCGSEFLKQEIRTINEDELREFKAAKVSSLQRSYNSSINDTHHQMLSFSSPSSQTLALPYNYYHCSTTSGFSRNSTGGYDSGGLRGPFTPSQWMELEHQALIYKYIIASVPIPSYLLNPIRKALESAGFSGLRHHNTLGWGGFHLGFSNADPEPGRCRRTDGKKWRCSRDAVPDQKYCERHLNRGRHRSRKPVEGQSATSSAKLPPVASSKLRSAGGDSNNLGLSRHKLNNLQCAANKNLSGIPNINRNLPEKHNLNEEYQHTTFLPETSQKMSLKEQNPYEESTTRQEFGFVCSDSLLNPLNRSSSLVSCRNYATNDNPNDHGNKSQHALHQFMDDWPKTQESSAISWPETHLSISTPMVTSDFMSSTTSPTGEKHTISPLRSSQGLEAIRTGLCLDTVTNDQSQSQTGWIPISWEPSMGGPLGEVLHTTSNGTGECKKTMALNLMERWDNNSPRLASSPTGVLQRCAFGSLSNSSAGSSPRAESSKALDGCNGINGSGLMQPSLPAL